jgi:serine phosphatase RsbU (regulator of sigma subunit)/anti-sigma regulatory factor (Ser/Thr protein kinase)
MAVFTGLARADGGWATIPLRTPAGMQGALHITFREPTEIGDAERLWLQAAVSQCAQALERSRLFEQEQLLRSRAERMQTMTAALSNALTRSDVAEVVVEEIGDGLAADRALFFVVDRERGALRSLAVREELETDASGPVEVVLDADSPASRAAARRTTIHGAVSDLREQHFDFPVAESWMADAASALFLPLVAGRHTNGLLALAWSEPRLVTEDERRYVETLAGQAALALDRASHFESERTIAETLQRSVLPVSLPRVEGVQLAARYLPGTAELAVGGDWFDAVKLPDGRLGLVVGDAVGKGVGAAASMGQLRNALRAFAVERLKPSSALARLNRLAEDTLETPFATVLYAVVDPAKHVCRYSSAGHPPPAVVYPDDRVVLLEGGRGLPLGAGADAKYRQGVADLPAGSVVLLYSDGLVEKRGHSLDEGFEKLVETLGDAPREPERLLEHVLEHMVGGEERGDDIALLAARVLTVAPQPLELSLSPHTGSLDIVRDALRVWLDSAGVQRPDADDVLLATWEACANAIEHAVDPIADLVKVQASLENSSVRVVVEDSGGWAPDAQRPGRGLGLRLMHALMTDVEVDTRDEGTRVTVEKRIAAVGESR